MGVVYRAVHRQTGRVVALKTVRQLSPDLLEAIRREIHALSSLQHEGVIAILDSGVERLSPWFAMEYLKRHTVADFYESLWSLRRTHANLTTLVGSNDLTEPQSVAEQALGDAPRVPVAGGRLPDVLALVNRLSVALAYVHGEGLVHRDLKPQNIFLRADGKPVLVDFGLTAWFGGAAGERLDGTKRRAGTVSFMAPEVARGEASDARADLYSLGCLFYLLVTGELPFAAVNDQEVLRLHRERAPRPPSTLVDGLPRSLDDLIGRLLAKAPEERTGHALDVVDELAPLLPKSATEVSLARAKRFYLYRPRLAGRDDLRLELDTRLAQVKLGKGGLVFLGGESGAGKTFFANDLATRAERLKLKVLTGECDPLGTAEMLDGRDERGAPLHPFRKFFGAVVDRCVQARGGGTAPLLAEHQLVLARYHPAFAELAAPEAQNPSFVRDGEEARSGGIVAMASALEAFAAESPTLLILDDLQWADALSLDVLRYLTPEFFGTHPLLIVGTYRTEEVTHELSSLLERTDAQLLPLPRLRSDAVASQVRDMLALATAPSALVTFLDENSEGVPFFIAEYLRAAMEKEILQRRGGHWLVSSTGESLDKLSTALDLPRSLQDLVGARLARLSPTGGAVAAMAAVLGRELDASVLGESAEKTPDQLMTGLTELLRLQILEQRTPGRYRFVHDKLREIAYQQTDATERTRLHARAALVIESRGEDPDSYPALAQHFRTAGETSKAVQYSRLAGREAWTKGAFQDAREHLGRALELSPTRNPQETTPQARLTEAQTRHWLASSLFCSGEVDQAIERFEESLTWLGQRPLPRSRGGWMRFIASLAIQQVYQRWAPPAMYEVRPEERRDIVAEAAQVAVRLSWSFAFRFKLPEMLASVLLGANLSDRASALGPRAAAHAALGSFLGHLGMEGIAGRYFERARRSATESKDPMALVREAQSECVFYLNQGRWDELVRCGEPALKIGVAVGATHETEALAQALSSGATLTGNLTEGERQARELADTAGRLGHRLQSWWGLLTVAATLFRRGRFSEVAHLLEPVEKGCREYNDVVSQLECLAFMAAIEQRQGDPTIAVKLAEEARAIAAGHGSGSLFGYTFHWLLPEVYAVEATRTSHEPAKRRQFLERFEESRRGARRFARMCRVALPFSFLQRGRSFQLQGRGPKAIAAFQESRRQAAAFGMPFDGALADLELARTEALEPSERGLHAARAREILDGLGCRAYPLGDATRAFLDASP